MKLKAKERIQSYWPSQTNEGAGILFYCVSTGNCLFLRRAGDSDSKGHWCLPGGGLELGENPRQAAIRETFEEAGFKYDGHLHEFCSITTDSYTFHNFLGTVLKEFVPVLNHEHDAFIWTSSPPEPVHPKLLKCLENAAARHSIPT